jgi:hypothetical protein
MGPLHHSQPQLSILAGRALFSARKVFLLFKKRYLFEASSFDSTSSNHATTSLVLALAEMVLVVPRGVHTSSFKVRVALELPATGPRRPSKIYSYRFW